MRKSVLALVGLLAALSLVLAACATPTPEVVERTVEVTTVVEEEVEVTAEPTEAGPVTEVRWFIGLGTGTNPEHQPVQELYVEAFNASHDDIELVLEVVPNDVAFDTLKTQLAGGDAPDIVGPVGVRGSNEFPDVWLDLDPYLADYDMSDFSEGAIDGWRMGDRGLIGLAVGVYPSAIYVNKDLFDEAGLDYPPQEYGEPYADGDEWNVDKARELAMQLTVDANGNDATMDGFDSENIVQYGWNFQWTDPRGLATVWGAGNFVDDEGNAYMPDHWRTAFDWYYNGMWEDFFIPNGPARGSDLMASGNPFGSGNLAMAHCHTWYTCCLGDVANWDYAVVPSYEGEATAKLHTDMVGVMNTTENPEAAVEVVYDIATSPQLISAWGVLPAKESLQDDFIASLQADFPDVNFDVALAGLNHVDVPNHEAFMPNFAQADDRVKELDSTLQQTPDLDLDAALDEFVSDMQEIFDAADAGE